MVIVSVKYFLDKVSICGLLNILDKSPTSDGLLHVAVKSKQKAITLLLLEHLAQCVASPLNFKNSTGDTALSMARNMRDSGMILLLLSLDNRVYKDFVSLPRSNTGIVKKSINVSDITYVVDEVICSCRCKQILQL